MTLLAEIATIAGGIAGTVCAFAALRTLWRSKRAQILTRSFSQVREEMDIVRMHTQNLQAVRS